MAVHSGNVIRLPDNIDTDIIIPTQYMTIETIEEMKQYAFSPLRTDIPQLVKPGDLIVAGKNFGCGSSREQAPEIIKALGFYCVIARSFARIFYRNAINNGLLVIENAALYDLINEGDQLAVDLENQQFILSNQQPVNFSRIPARLLDMIQCGGLVNYYKNMNQK